MCHLNLFIKAKQTKNTNEILNLTSFLNMASANSYTNNNDGEGIYLDYPDKLTISKRKINLFNKQKLKEIAKSNFILLHERLTTSGRSLKYTQPLGKEEFILLHNGILSDFDINKKSDSYNLFMEFLKEFRKSTIKSRNKRLISCLKQILSEQNGSFSISLFDKITRKLYYFKNDSTTINFHLKYNKEQLYITTSNFNDDYLKVFELKGFNEKKIKDFLIYSIQINKNKIRIKQEGKIKENEGGFTFKTKGSWDNFSNFGEREPSKTDLFSCSSCGELVPSTEENKEEYALCGECLRCEENYIKNYRQRSDRDLNEYV